MNTLFSYQYRDDSNYKIFEDVVIRGEFSLADIEAFLFESQFFIPFEVGLNDLQKDPFTIHDHIWHEIIELIPTSNRTTFNVSAKQMIKNFKEAAKNDWNQRKTFKRHGLI